MYMNVEERIKTDAQLPLRRRTVIHLMLVNNHLQDVLASALKPFDVSLQQFNVLRILRGQKDKPANLSTLSERMVSRMSNTTRLVDKLIAKDFVRRNTCPENRRKIEIRLTRSGREALENMDVAVEAAEQKLMHALSKEQLKDLNILLDHINSTNENH
jgi:DNA-binding MarR family transcriptional regulator